MKSDLKKNGEKKTLSNLGFRIEETSDLERDGNTDKKGICYRRKIEKQTKQNVETVVQLLWRASAPRLKPLRLPRAQACGNMGGS